MNFNDKCFELISEVPKGKVTTYKEIARVLHTKAYQAVGSAMAKNNNLFTSLVIESLRAMEKLGVMQWVLIRKLIFCKKKG